MLVIQKALTESELDVIDDWKLYSNLVQIKGLQYIC